MTAAHLEKAIKQNQEAVIRLFHGLDEKSRRALAPAALEWDKALNRDFNPKVNGIDRTLVHYAVPLALLGCATLAELKKARLIVIPEPRAAAEVLRERRPEWLQEYSVWVLESNPRSWTFVRCLEKAGLITAPSGESYMIGLIAAASRREAYRLLIDEPELIEQVDRLFEIEGSGEFSLAAHDKYSAPEAQWAYALKRLSQEGRLARQQLLSRALQALTYGFAAFRAGWFSRFYEAMEPTADETARDMDTLLLLLGSPVPATANFALKTLTAVAKKHKPEPEKLWATLGPVWTLPQKGPVLQGLKLLAGTPPGESWLEHLTQAAAHPSPDVQREALKNLKKVAPRPASPWRERWLDQASALEPSVRGDWSDWIGAEPATSASRSAARHESIQTGPRDNESTGAPVQTISPCADLQEVFDLAARLLEEPSPPHDIERMLDGICRFQGAQHPQAPALRKRVKTRLKSPDLRRSIAALLSTWLGQPQALEVPSRAGLESFLHLRLQELNGHLSSYPFLCCLPEREDGGLSPSALANRLAACSQPGRYDFAQALLRLDCSEGAPEQGSGEAFEALVYALGGRAGRRLTPIWWQAADLLRDNRQPRPWTFQVSVSSHEYGGKTYYHRHLRIPELAQRSGAGILWEDHTESADSLRWQALIGPALRETFQLVGIEQIANNLDWWGADWSDRVYLESLLQPGERWLRSGAFLAALGLSCKEPGQRGLAVDAVAQGLSTGSLAGPVLGRVMGEASSTGMITAKRWATSFDELRRFVDQAHLLAAFEAFFATSSPNLDARPLLAPLLEVAMGLGKGVTDQQATVNLQALARSGGKSGKQAAGILAMG